MHDYKSNRELLEEFNQSVRGHIEAKKAIIKLVNRSKIRYNQKYKHLNENYHTIETNKILLLGASGTGKTFLVETAAKIMNFPLVKIDATELAPASADGLTLERLKKLIIEKANNLVESSPNYHSEAGVIGQTVIFIDEIDKLAKPAGDKSGDWHKRIQASLLTFIEDKQLYRGLSFIFAGAFTGIEQQVTSMSIGFNPNPEKYVAILDWEHEIVKYGLIPELVGRMHGVYPLDILSKHDYKIILETILMPKKLDELLYFNCTELNLKSFEIDEMIDKAFKSGQGIRSLKRELNKKVADKEFYYEDAITEQLMLENMVDRFGCQSE